MSKHGKAPLLIALFTLVLVVAISLSVRVEESLAQETPQEPEAELPIADYDAPEPADKEKREKRRAKGQKFNSKSDRPIDPANGDMTRTTHSHWFYGLTPLPTAQSGAVVIGEVVDANAYLSPDRTEVYSEYTVRVEEVLKTDDSAIAPNSTIDLQRYGGRVRLPSGLVQKYEASGMGAPRVGRKYALFVERRQQELQIVTGYELHQNKVKPLDSVQMFQVYKGMDVQTFMDKLRQAIINPQTRRGMSI
jgi:hypothetical protein